MNIYIKYLIQAFFEIEILNKILLNFLTLVNIKKKFFLLLYIEQSTLYCYLYLCGLGS